MGSNNSFKPTLFRNAVRGLILQPNLNILAGMKILIAMAIVAFPLSSHAIEYVREENGVTYHAKSVHECLNFGDIHVSNACVVFFYEESEEDLEETVNAMRSGLILDADLLVDSQRKWELFKVSECELQSVSARAYRDPAGQKQILFEVCAADLNRLRIDQLKNIPLYCDSCLQ